MSRRRLLDLYSGAGGCARGYQMAGFHVTGVDIRPQPRYAGEEFIHGDVLGLDHAWIREGFAAVHASPPCQAYIVGIRNMRGYRDNHPDLLPPTRELLEATGLPYIIENVPGAPMRRDVILCGSMFGLEHNGRQLRRHRWFELGNWSTMPLTPPCRHHLRAHGIFGHSRGDARWGGGSARDHMTVMGIDWMRYEELTQAIPPAYTEWLGRRLLAALGVEATSVTARDAQEGFE